MQVLIVIITIGGLGLSLLLVAMSPKTAIEAINGQNLIFNYSALMMKIIAVLIASFWLIQCFVEQKISLIKSSFWKPLILLVGAVCFSTWLNVPIENVAPWFGWGGMWIALGLIVIVGGSIFQPRQLRLAFKLLSFWAIGAGIIIFIKLVEELFNLNILEWDFNLLPTTWVAIFLVFLAGFIVYFIKKGKTPWFQKLLLPFLVLGILSAGTLAYRKPEALKETANWRISWQVWQTSWDGIEDESVLIQIGRLLFGWGSDNYASFYQLFKPRWVNQSVWHSQSFSQSSLGVLTLFSTLGVVGGGAIVWLVVKMWQNLFNQLNKGNYFFLMATTAWTLQLLVPLDVVLLFLAAILLALGLCQRPRQELSKNWATPVWMSWVLNGLGVMILGGMGWMTWQMFDLARIGTIYQKAEQDFEQAKLTRDGLLLDKGRLELQKVMRKKELALFNQKMAVFDLERIWWHFEEVRWQVADLEQQTKALNNVLFQIKGAIRLAPFEAENWQIMGDVYRNTAQINADVQATQSEAEKAYRQVIQLEPQTNRGWLSLGNLFLDQNRIEEAIEAFKRAVEIQNQSVIANYALAKAYARANKREQAYQAYQSTLSFLDPTLPSYNQDYQQLSQEMKGVEPRDENIFLEEGQLFSQQVVGAKQEEEVEAEAEVEVEE